MAETKMRLVDWLDDLCVRFIINLPREDMESVERICFQVEEAQWFYEDFIRPTDATLPSMNLRQFCLLIFQHCPLLASFSEDHHLQAFEEFITYKTRVPVRGAILLNEAMDHVLLVKGWKKNATWSFPRGKINKDEEDLDCAIREVYEETGYDVMEAGLVQDRSHVHHIQVTMREQNLKMFVFRGVPMDTPFAPRTRKEISKIEWYKLSSLPGYNKKKQQQHVQGYGVEVASFPKLYMVAPFFGPLKKWIAQTNRTAPGIVAENAWQQQQQQQTFEISNASHQLGVIGSGPSPGHLQTSSAMPSQSVQASSGVLDAAAKIKALLSVKPSAPAAKQPSSSSQESALLAMLRRPTKEVIKETFEQQSSIADSSVLDGPLPIRSDLADAPPLSADRSVVAEQIARNLPTAQTNQHAGNNRLAHSSQDSADTARAAPQIPSHALDDRTLGLLDAFKSTPHAPKQGIPEKAASPWGKLPNVQATSLVDLFKNPPTVADILPLPQAELTPGPVELSATRSPNIRAQQSELAAVPSETSKIAKTGRRPDRGTSASQIVSGTMTGPANTSDTGTVRRRNRGGNHASKSQDIQITPMQILKRPVSDTPKDSEPQIASLPLPVPKQPVEIPEESTKSTQTFVPQILARPHDSRTTSPAKRATVNPVASTSTTLRGEVVESTETTPAKPFQILKRPQPSEQVMFKDPPQMRTLPVELSSSTPSPFDRRTSTNNDRKQALLSLFGGGPTSSTQTPAPINTTATLPGSISFDTDTAIVSPVNEPLHSGMTSPPETTRGPQAVHDLSRSRINSIASAPRAGSASAAAPSLSAAGRPQTPMSPQDRGFLMSFLEGVVKKAAL